MRILKISKLNTVLVSMIMMAILLCCSSQVQAAQEGDYTYTVTDGEAQLMNYTGDGGDVTVPSTLGGFPVTSIGHDAFSFNYSLTSISLPQDLTNIGDSAFWWCTGLTDVSIPNGVTSIGSGAFYNCYGLNSINLPQGLVSIGDGAFSNCSGLTSINLPQGLTSIGDGAFTQCSGLLSITVDNGNLHYASINGLLFNNAGTNLIACPGGLTSISLPQGLTSIGNNAFDCCTGLTSISLPQGVTSIGNLAFDSCTGLTSISLPQGLTSIGASAFQYCTGLTSINIPQGVKSVGGMAFYSCYSLASITFNSATTIISDGKATIPGPTKIIGYDPSTAKDYAFKYGREFEVIGSIKVTGVKLNKNDTTINVGANETLIATITPDNATDKSVTWSVFSQSGSNVVTVSETGLVSAVNPGTAVIRATSNADPTKYAECSVTVTGVGDYLSNWNLRNTLPQGNNLHSVAYGKNTFVEVGDSGSIFSSTDGITWTSRTSGTTQGLEAVTFDNNSFVVVGNSGVILTSTDGKTWAKRTSGTTNALYGVTYGNNTFVVVGSSGVILTSPDGTTWTGQTAGTEQEFYGVTYGNNIFVAVELSKIFTSPDGITWTLRAEDQSQIIRNITYGNNTFVAVGGWENLGAQIFTSPDGITWTSRSSGETYAYALGGVTYGNNTFVAVGMLGEILTSPDGITWTSRTSGTTEWLGGVTYGSKTFVAVGDNGTVLQSDPFAQPTTDITDFKVPKQVGDSTIDATEHTVTFHMPYGTSVTKLVPTIAISTGATIDPKSKAAKDFTNPVLYTVKAQDGKTQTWRVTCIVDLNTANDILSFTVPGQVGNATIDTTNHTVTFHVPYGTSVTSLAPTITLSSGAAISPTSGITQDFTSPVAYTVTAENQTSQTWTVTGIIDPNRANAITEFTVLGQVGSSTINQTNHTVTFHMPYGTNINSLAPSIGVSPEATIAPLSGANQNFTKTIAYTVIAQNETKQTWKVTCVVDPNSAKEITSLTIPNQIGNATIDSTSHTVTFHMLYGTDVKRLAPTISVSEKATMSPGSKSSQNFTNAVNYTVKAQDKTAQTWTVTCIIDPISSENDITDFTVPKQLGSSTIDPMNHAVTFHMPYGSSVTRLAPIITLSTGATISPASKTAIDFTNPVSYTVTAQDGSIQIWSVTCVVDPKSSAKDITGFTVPRQIGNSTIDLTDHTVTFHMANGTSVGRLAPTITISANAMISPGSRASKNFSSPVIYTVTAQDGSIQTWTVTCIVDPKL